MVAGANEQSPLLGSNTGLESGTSKTDVRLSRLRRKVYVLCFLLILLTEIGSYVKTAALNQVLEKVICHDQYPELARLDQDNGDASPCKSKSVQSELALLRGWSMTFEYLPGILTTIPYGFMADKYGRKPVFILAVLGIFLESISYTAVCWWSAIFPVRVTWLSSVFLFIGGGSAVANSMIFTMIADVTSDERRAIVFFYLASAVLLGELSASAMASVLLRWGPWLPIVVGNICIALGLFASLGFPETLGARVVGSVPPDLVDDDGAEVEHGRLHWYHKARTAFGRLSTAAIHFIWSNKHVALLLSTYIMTTLGRLVSEILLQYATKRYHWSWARASFLLSLRATSAFILLVIILPGMSYLFISKLKLSAQSKDLWLARVSIVASVIGSFAVGLSANPVFMLIGLVIWALGAGYNLLVRSLLTSMVEPHHIATLYNTMAVLETIGVLIAGPLLSFTFRRGLDLGGEWIGLPFIGAGLLFTIAAAVIFGVRIPQSPKTS